MVAVVGGDTLLAREILERLGESAPAPRVQLISAAPAAATLLAEAAEEAVVMMPLAAESLEGSSVAFLAGSPASSRRTLKLNPTDGPMLIDLTGALEEKPNARLRAPSAEASRPAPSADSCHRPPGGDCRDDAAGAAFAHAQPFDAPSCTCSSPPASAASAGWTNFASRPSPSYPSRNSTPTYSMRRLAFNLLARYGEEALEPLDSIEHRLERHLASLLAAYPSIPMPSLRMIQVPVFHGHSFSVWVEFEGNPAVDAIARSLAGAGLDVRPDEPPDNVGVASSEGLSVGAITQDRNHHRACWFWLAADNLRLVADNAVAVARESR